MKKSQIALGLVANWKQFTLLLIINGFVGAMVGLERTVVPLIANADFGLTSKSVIMSFLVSFGVVKALANLYAGRMSDVRGRKSILVAGWLAGLPVPFLIMFAPGWSWIVFANMLLGINQGLCWSTTVIMKIDLVGPKRRGLAMGLNEATGYVAVSLSALLTGYLASVYGLRPVPFVPGVIFALSGLLLSSVFAHDTRDHVRFEGSLVIDKSRSSTRIAPKYSFAEILLLTSWRDRALFSVSQAGLVNNLNDGMVWGLLPIYLAARGLPLERIGVIAATYPGVWGLSQLLTGAMSDRLGRKRMIATGMWVQAIGIGLFVTGFGFVVYIIGAVLLGLGTGLVYPTLLAAVSDVAHPEWRSTAVGVYRLWRDGGYAVGALLSGFLADTFNILTAISVIGILTFSSGLVVAIVMYETHSEQGRLRKMRKTS